jgi:hypothetical protein
MRRRPEFRVLAIILGIGLAVGVGGGATYAAFSATTSNGGNSLATAADWTAPAIGTSVIAKNSGYSAGFIMQGGVYRVYANVTDSGNPSSGISTVTANVSNITSGQTAVSLSSGSFTVAGTSYGYRSGSVTADGSLSAGSKSFSITATDGASNSATQGGFTVTVDNSAPGASDVQAANGGSIVGRAEQNDTLTFTFNEQMDPDSILSGWSGDSTAVVVRLNNSGGSDNVTVFNSANSTQLNLGSVALNGNYTTSSITFGATGTASSMVQSGSIVTITLGNASGTGSTVSSATRMAWTPSASATDRAGNACSTTAVNEGGGNDVDF